MIGIELLNNPGQFLDLDPGFKLTIDVLNPAYDDDLTGGDHSFPIDFPAGGKNDILLNMPAGISVTRKEFRFDVRVWMAGNIWRRAKLVIDRPGTSRHGGYLLTGLRAWDLDMKLYDVPMGGERVFGTTSDDIRDHATSVWTQHWPDVDYNFPTIRCESFYGDANPDWKYFINRFDRTNAEYFINAAGTFPNKDCLVPCPYYAAVMKYVIESQGYTADTSYGWFNDGTARKLVMPNNVPLDRRFSVTTRASMSYAGPITLILDQTDFDGTNNPRIPLNDDSTAPNQDPGSEFNTTTWKWAVPVANKYYRMKFKVRFRVVSKSPSSNYVLKELTCGLGVLGGSTYDIKTVRESGQGIQIGQWYEVSSSRIKFLTTAAEEISLFWTAKSGCDCEVEISEAWASFELLDTADINVYRNTINLQDHVPDKTVGDFLKDFRDFFQVQFLIDDVRKVVKIARRDINLSTDAMVLDDFAGTAHDSELIEDQPRSIGFSWPSEDSMTQDNFKTQPDGTDLGEVFKDTDLPSPSYVGQSILVTTTGQRWIVGLDNLGALEWQHYSDEFYDRELNPDGTFDIKVNITPLVMRYYDTPETGEIICPKMEMQARSPDFGLNGDRMTSLRIINMVGDDDGTTYPLATSLSFSLTSAQICNQIRYWPLSGDGGDMAYWIENWLKMLQLPQLFRKLFYFDINTLARMGSEYKMIGKSKLNNVSLVVKRSTFTTDGKSVDPCETEFYVIPKT